MSKAHAPVTIPLWSQDADGRVVAPRAAEFWRPLRGKGAQAIQCTLCYRRCELAPGEAGWCKYRGNAADGGKMELYDHGVVASLVRDQYGYGGYHVLQTYKPGALALDIGLTRCTARCVFCVSGNMVWRPDAVPWAYGGERRPGHSGGWHARKAMLHPSGVLAQAQRIGASEIEFEVNEPTLSWEYTYDVVRLAKQNNLGVTLFTNGFTTVEPIRSLARYVDAIYLGLKGSLDPAFYDRWMKAPGAVPAVKEAARTWHQRGVRVLVGDVLASPHMQTDDAQAEHQQRLFAWIAATLGPMTIYQPMIMSKPSATKAEHALGLMIPAGADPIATEAHIMERREATLERARAAGLQYAIDDARTYTCHACGGVLLRFHAPGIHCEPCIMPTHFCPFWWHEQYAHDGRCDHCGTAVPIVTLPDADLAAVRRHVARETRQKDADREPLNWAGVHAMERAEANWQALEAEPEPV